VKLGVEEQKRRTRGGREEEREEHVHCHGSENECKRRSGHVSEEAARSGW